MDHFSYIDKMADAARRTTLSFSEKKELVFQKGIGELLRLFLEVRQSGNVLFIIGNGGSAAIASHMTADFARNGGMKALSLYDGALLTCMGNDYGYENIFSRPLSLLGRENDLLIAISSSGNSQNIINAIAEARKRKMKVLTLSGVKADNRIGKLGDFNIHVPAEHYGIVETLHQMILQEAVDLI